MSSSSCSPCTLQRACSPCLAQHSALGSLPKTTWVCRIAGKEVAWVPHYCSGLCFDVLTVFPPNPVFLNIELIQPGCQKEEGEKEGRRRRRKKQKGRGGGEEEGEEGRKGRRKLEKRNNVNPLFVATRAYFLPGSFHVHLFYVGFYFNTVVSTV